MGAKILPLHPPACEKRNEGHEELSNRQTATGLDALLRAFDDEVYVVFVLVRVKAAVKISPERHGGIPRMPKSMAPMEIRLADCP